MQLNDGRQVNTFATLVVAKDGETWRIEADGNFGRLPELGMGAPPQCARWSIPPLFILPFCYFT
jgi:hypothetical protein